ncbi:hypothetical protein EV668_4571 [Enterovirga rhinocerotis]|uniref:Uncharacterized protein n=1 Tax=Enterovirga rhinocerotis TaxID=1339210 RepID=A0A4V3DWN4_9HYPH|nr:hypothetical protein EV668_4571 [Enterovirga rhinocerotis]
MGSLDRYGLLNAALGAAFVFVAASGPAQAQTGTSDLVALFETLCISPRTNEGRLEAAARVAGERAWGPKRAEPARAGLHGFLPGTLTAWTVKPPPEETVFMVFLVDPAMHPGLEVVSCGFFMADNSPGADDLVPEVDRRLGPGMVRSRARSFSAETKYNWFDSPDGKHLTNCSRRVAVMDNLASRRSSFLMLTQMDFPDQPPWNTLPKPRCPAQPE